MTRSVRFYWRGLKGRRRINVNWPPINVDSTVKVTASEWAPNPDNLKASPRFVGSATITVRNIAPHGPKSDPNHGVTFIVDVDWPTPLNVVTDIALLEESVLRVQHPPLIWRQLPFIVQTQQQSNWCWCAVTVSIANFYGANLTQCGFANTELGRNDCCGAGGPDTARCNVAHSKEDSLRTAGHYGSVQAGGPTLARVRAEIDAGRPIALRVAWKGGGAHSVAIGGYLANSDFVAVDDPLSGASDVVIGKLNASYQGNGSVTHTWYTTP